MVDMIINNLLARTECQLVKSNTTRCLLSKSMRGRWINTAKKLCLINSINNRNKLQRKIQFKTKFKRSNRFVWTTMPCSVIPNSQLTTRLFTTTQCSLQSTPWTCLWWSGKDLRKLCPQTPHQLCTGTEWTLEISNKEHWETAGSSALFWFKARTLNY